jgi:hypothetical protein
VGTAGLKSWNGEGEVVTSSTEGPWITVKLFDFEDGADKVDVRLTTPYSGTDGVKGIHAVPEEGTRIILGWSGHFGDSVLLIGNVRSDPADLESPSLWLEKTSQLRTADIEAQDLGEIMVESELSVSLDKSSEIRGADKMELDVDGTKVKMVRGTFYTGKA